MYRTLVKILLEIYCLDFFKLYDEEIVSRFKDSIYRYLSCSSDYDEFRSKLCSTSLSLPKSSWTMIRDFLFYLDNFELYV